MRMPGSGKQSIRVRVRVSFRLKVEHPVKLYAICTFNPSKISSPLWLLAEAGQTSLLEPIDKAVMQELNTLDSTYRTRGYAGFFHKGWFYIRNRSWKSASKLPKWITMSLTN